VGRIEAFLIVQGTLSFAPSGLGHFLVSRTACAVAVFFCPYAAEISGAMQNVPPRGVSTGAIKPAL
jgi:hypothetical protein